MKRRECFIAMRGIGFAIFASLLIACCSSGLEAKKVSLKLKAPKAEVSSEKKNHKTTSKKGEAFTNVAKALTFTGYDKKPAAATETFFIGNGSDQNLKMVELEITYLTPDGKQLHKRTVEIEQWLPSGETRKIDIPSWDKQKSFHYVKSPAGKSGSAPYTVRFKIKSFITE